MAHSAKIFRSNSMNFPQMKLALIFLTVGVALVMGQNYYMQFSGSKNRHLPPYSDSGEMVANVYVPEEVASPFYRVSFYRVSLQPWVSRCNWTAIGFDQLIFL